MKPRDTYLCIGIELYTLLTKTYVYFIEKIDQNQEIVL